MSNSPVTSAGSVNPPLIDSNHIFIAGAGENTNGRSIAKIWNGGIAQTLGTDQYESVAKAVFVANGSVYVVGYEWSANNKAIAKIWKDKVPKDLSNGQFSAAALSVYVFNEDVYVAGWEMNASNKAIAKIWKNGIALSLSDGQFDAIAYSVYVSNGDVYVAGFDFKTSQYSHESSGMVWKNGQPQVLGNLREAAVVRVNGSNLYVAGRRNDFTGTEVLKNGVFQPFIGVDVKTLNTVPSMTIFNNDVYLAGTLSGNGNLCTQGAYWKNGQLISKQACGTYFNSVFAAGNNVYITGEKEIFENGIENSYAMLWKNNVPYALTGMYAAYSVFVQ